MSLFTDELKRRINEYYPSLGDRKPGMGTGGLLGLIERMLSSTGSGKGASQIGIEDSGALITATTVEAALAELATAAPATIVAADGDAIPVTGSGTVAFTTGGGGETNTVAIPTFLGQRLLLVLDVDGGGDRVVTFASAINVAGNTIATFATARQNLVVEAIQLAGVLAWEVTSNNGTVALS